MADDLKDQPKGVVPPKLPEEEVASEAAPGLTQEQFHQMLNARFTQIVSEVVGALHVFAPHVPHEAAIRLGETMAREQMDGDKLPQVTHSIADPDQVAKYPTLYLWIADGKNGVVMMKGPKRLERVHDLQAVAHSAVILAFILSPAARAVLRAFGFTYTFVASSDPPGGKIILNS